MVRAWNVGKSFDGDSLFEGASFHVRRGDRLAIAGPNGSGKTRLLRILHGTTEPDEGAIEMGSRVKIGYYAQSAENLDASMTPLAICRRELEDETTVRTMLGCLRLPAGHVTRPVGALSAGERSKVAPVHVLLSRVNLLLLDEPTNHLEIEAIEAVQETFAQFPGAIVFVTHE